MEDEIAYNGESACEECGFSLMYEDEPLDFTLDVETKEEYFEYVTVDGFFDHVCHFTDHYEYDEPTVETVEY